jgi:prepilin-type N-terminal cleavage/methylation domain-containing protein
MAISPLVSGRPKSSPSEGFSIVELMITLAIAALAATMLMSLYITADGLTTRATHYASANQVAYAKLQSYENRSFSSININTGSTSAEIEDFVAELNAIPGLPPPRVAKVYGSYNNGTDTTASLKYILVRVSFGQGADARIIEYGDYIANGGQGR